MMGGHIHHVNFYEQGQIKAKTFWSEGKQEKQHILLGPRMTRFSVNVAPAKPGRSNFPLLMISKVIYVFIPRHRP